VFCVQERQTGHFACVTIQRTKGTFCIAQKLGAIEEINRDTQREIILLRKNFSNS